MCGVSAIYAFHSSAPLVDREELRRIRDYMALRGPDAKGEWYSEDGRLGVGHRRLSIIDLSAKGMQPMLNARRNLVLSFNGEIYNYKSLRASLEKDGRTFRTATDTEVLLKLYEEKGEAMLESLRGMFAFALWDASKGKLILARDTYGIKPLYYANDGWTVRVASQVKALLAGGRVSREIDPAGHVGFFLFGSVPEPYTSYQEIREVPAGSIVEVDNLGPSTPRYWSSLSKVFLAARDAQRPRRLDEAKEIVREAVRDSVVHHLISDVPVGAFLSAGVDSTTIVGLASEAGLQGIDTLTLAFSEFSHRHEDEAPVAEETARRYGTAHTTFRVAESEFRDDLPKILEAMDQPTIDGINTWMVSKKAAELGLKVCLSGLGGDELFAGYPSFRQLPTWVRAMWIPSRVPLLGRTLRAGFKLTGAQSLGLNPKSAGLISYGGTYPGAYLLKRGLFMPWELPDIMGRELAMEGLRRLKVRQHIGNALTPDPGCSYSRVACLESSLYLRNQLLRDADWAGMAHSLEIRTPLVDLVLLSCIAPLACTRFMKSGKTLLGASPGNPIDAMVAKSAKTGFSLPMERWVSNLRDTLDSWRRVPSLARSGCHWARRVAYAIHEHAAT